MHNERTRGSGTDAAGGESAAKGNGLLNQVLAFATRQSKVSFMQPAAFSLLLHERVRVRMSERKSVSS